MISAETARSIFFNEVDRILEEYNMPFTYSRRKQYAIINRATPNFSKPCISLEFLWKDETIRISVFILDDLALYNKLLSIKDNLEELLGFHCTWKNGDKNSTSKRICVNMPFNKYTIDNNKYAMQSIEYVEQFINVFGKYLY